METEDRPDMGRHSRGLRAYWRAVRLLADIGMALAGVLVLIDLTLIGLGVIMRYFFSAPIVWADELVALSLTAIILLAAPKMLLLNQHVEVDIVTYKLTGRARAIARGWSALAVLAVAALLIFNGWKTAMLAKMIRLVTEGELELPLWMLQLLLPFGGICLALAGIAQLWAAIESWSRTRQEAA